MSPHRDINKRSEVKIVHTSVHGVGHAFVQSAFSAFDLHPPYAVEEQKDPDPEFPTVKYPNPEEGEGVLVCCGDSHSHAVMDRRAIFFFFKAACVCMCVCYRHCRLHWPRRRGPLLCWRTTLMLIVWPSLRSRRGPCLHLFHLSTCDQR